MSLWVDITTVTTKDLSVYENIVDDISLLKTVIFDTSKSGMVPKIEPSLRTTPPPDEKLLGDAIAACHKKKIQCLAGFGCVNMEKQAKKINDFLKGSSPDFAGIAKALVKWVNSDYTDSAGTARRFDGLSFDLEDNTDSSLGPQYTKFYQAIADELAKATGDHANKFVSVANGGLVSDTDATKVSKGALASAISQPYKMAAGKMNLILRPMCYDVFQISFVNPGDATTDTAPPDHKPPPSRRNGGNDALIRDWHKDIWTYATGEGVKASQFQYGIKTFAGPRNKPLRVTDASGTFQRWSVAPNHATDGYIDVPSEVRARVREMQARGTGIIFFGPQSATEVAKVNFILNSTTTAPTANDANGDYPDLSLSDPSKNTAIPSVATRPEQFPHTAESIKRLKTA